MDYKVEVWLVPLNQNFEPREERALIKSVTCVSNLDTLMTAGQEFLEKLPSNDNHTTWS